MNYIKNTITHTNKNNNIITIQLIDTDNRHAKQMITYKQ